jgi:hypothetical protein
MIYRRDDLGFDRITLITREGMYRRVIVIALPNILEGVQIPKLNKPLRIPLVYSRLLLNSSVQG